MNSDSGNSLVSVIMCVKNGGRFFPSAVESVLQQEYKPLEIIVVDGQSTDGTTELAKSIKGVEYIYQQDQGLANARNCGLQASRGKFVAFLDSDDIWKPAKIITQIRYLSANPNCQGTVTLLRYILEPEYYHHKHPGNDRYGITHVGYTPSALFASRELYFQVGLFDPSYTVACDLDWFAKLLLKKLSVAVIPEVYLLKRIHASNLSLDIELSRSETFLVLENILRGKRRTQPQ